MAAPKTKRRWWRWPLYVLGGIVLVLAVLVIALQTPWVRERARVAVNGVLATTFQGTLVIDRLGTVTPWGISGVDAHVLDAQGRRVIFARGLSGVIWLPGLVRELLFNAERPQLSLRRVQVDYADVTLRDDEELGVSLARAFLPRPSPEEPGAKAPPDAGVRLVIEQVRFERVWVHGSVSGSPPLDADLLQLRASLRQTPLDGFELALDDVSLITRALPLGLDPRGRLSGSVSSPAEGRGPLRLEGVLDGSAGGSPVSTEVSWVGDHLHAALSAPQIPAAFVNAQAPGLTLDGDVTLRADVDGDLPELDYEVEVDGRAAHVLASGYAVVSAPLELVTRVAVTRVDLAAARDDAPKSQLDALARGLLFEADDGHFDVAARVEVAPGSVAGEATPGLWLSGAGELDAERGNQAHGRLAAAEPGIDVSGSYELRLPRGRADLLALSLRARFDEPRRLQQLGLRASGTAELGGELVPSSGRISAKTSLSVSRVEREPISARNLELRAAVSGSIAAPRVHAATTLDIMSGRAHADLDYGPDAEQLDVFVTNVDLRRLLHVLGLRLPLERGNLELDARLARRARERVYTLDATAKSDLGQLGAVKLTARDLKLPRRLGSRANPWNDVEGQLSARGNLELEALSPLLIQAGLPVERTTGHVRFEAAATRRADASNGPELSAQLDTNGLRIVQQRTAPSEIRTTGDAIATRPQALEGIDVHASAHAWPSSGDIVATVILRDPGGTLLQAEAATRLPKLVPLNAASLSRLPLQAQLEVPERRLQSLPPLIRPAALRGRVAAQARFEGSLMDPRVEAQLLGRSLRAAGSKDPVDADLDARYAPSGGQLHVRAQRPGARAAGELASATATWQGTLRNALDAAPASAGLVASADVQLREFPLDVVPPLVDRQLAGRVSGDFKLEDWGRQAKLEARLDSTSLVLGKVPVRNLAATLTTSEDQLQAEVALAVAGGNAHGKLEADMRWGSRPAPTLGHRGAAVLEAHAFQLEALSPLLSAYVSELSGVLDAQTRLDVAEQRTQVSGSARLAHGVVQVPAIGQRFSDIAAEVSVAADRFRLERLEARGTTGRLSARGQAQLDGFALRRADAQLTIRKNESLPITLEGVVLGDAWGSVNANYDSPAKGERRLNIDVPELHLLAPENSGHGLQSLEPAESIRVGVRRADGKFVALPVQPLEADATEADVAAGAEAPQPLRVTVKLGNNVSVERGRSAQAQLTGQLTVLVATRTEVDGRIEVRGGKLDVSGKTFEIERGVVTFSGDDPANPSIAATARWDAPGYSVYADYVGDVKDGRIKLHSEPPLTQDEIASLLLFGSPEGSVGGSNTSGAALAVSVAGESAVKGLNQVLDDFTNLDVSARVDTTTGSARPELVFQVSPRVAAKVTRAIGTPAAGESPDRTFLTLELRLKRAWALSAVFGDRGASALDLIWRRRY
jgi:autotransporter translocation and assembly factor TamB